MYHNLRRFSGFGKASYGDGFLVEPSTFEEVRMLFAEAAVGRKIVLRGSGMSYGDAAFSNENTVLSTKKYNSILSWDKDTGILVVEPGVTLEECWKKTLPDGWYLPVVSGTMKVSVGGAIAMNIHGKNNTVRGTFGENLEWIEVLTPKGEDYKLTPESSLFRAIVSGAGCLGFVTKAAIKMKRIASGKVRVKAVSCSDWDDQFAAFEKYSGDSEYMVSWVDAFAFGDKAGRGVFHAGWHVENDPQSLSLEAQDLPSKIMGIVPKNQVWRILKMLNRRPFMKVLNALKHQSGKREAAKGEYTQSLAEFNFLLDYVPGWERAYDPYGLVQCQVFVPGEKAPDIFPRLMEMQRAAQLENFLTVMKKHRKDSFLLSHGVDGYSLAMDFKVTPATHEPLWSLIRALYNFVLPEGGRLYLAKDSVMTKEQAEQYLGLALDEYRALKAELDPDGILTSNLAERIGLVG